MLPNYENEIFYQIALTLVPEVGPKTARTLLNHYQTAEDIFKASPKELKGIGGVGEVRAKMLFDNEVLKRAEQELQYVTTHDIIPLVFNTEAYPKRLTECDDAPTLLYYKGQADLNTKKVVAVIGTRKNTDYGQRVCEDLFAQLNGVDDLLVVSGLALGIDTLAHKGSLNNNIPTVGVLGHGLERL